MSIKTRIAALALAALAVTGTIASTTTRHRPSRSAGAGALEPASSAPRSSAPRSPPATTATTTTAIAAAAGFASSTLTAITWAASVPAVTDCSTELGFCLRSVFFNANRIERLAENASHVDLRPARAPHPPRAAPDPPGCPPGRVNFFGCSLTVTRACPALLQNCHRAMPSNEVRHSRLLAIANYLQ